MEYPLGISFTIGCGPISSKKCSISVSQVLYKPKGVCEFKEPKTAHGSRRVGMTDRLASYLKDYKARQLSLCIEEGKVLSLDTLVFNNHGKPIDLGVLSHTFARIVKRPSLQNVRFHDPRHTFASLMLLQGAPAKVISEALGHSSVAFTMDV